jgi:tetratricopeptide (TPR) repeat protein
MKIHCCIAFLLLFNLQFAFSQNSLEELLAKGIEAHDQGEYQTAIDYYKKALAIDKQSGILCYELALSFYLLKDYKNTVKYADKALKFTKEEQILLSAYLVKGAALDDSGNRKKSIKVYSDTI